MGMSAAMSMSKCLLDGFKMTLIVGVVGPQVVGLGHYGFKLALIVGALTP